KREARSEKREARSEKREARKFLRVGVCTSTLFVFGIRFNVVFLTTNSVNTYDTSTSFNSIPTNTSDFNSEAIPPFEGNSPSS
ncbi:hypothetical protein OQJ86_26085, partial [Vibrio sp. Sgm 5]|nr:hypothetical protein [Vibrio sp. Sgm 5]